MYVKPELKRTGNQLGFYTLLRFQLNRGLCICSTRCRLTLMIPRRELRQTNNQQAV